MPDQENSLFASAPRIVPTPELWERIHRDAKFPPRGRLLAFRRTVYALAASILVAAGTLLWTRQAMLSPAVGQESDLLDATTVEWYSILGTDSVSIDETVAAMEWVALLGSNKAEETALPLEDLVNDIFTTLSTKGEQI